MASKSSEVAKRAEVSTDDGIPDSAEWGWHGGFPTGTIVGGVITIILCLAFIPGPYQSETQDFYLIGIVVVIIGGIVWHVIRRRNAWRR